MYLLAGILRPYAWGSTTAMAELFGRDPSGEPEAELWFGAHPGAPSRIVAPEGGPGTLDELISAEPVATLGRETMALHGPALPFLAKLLAAGSPLSLQVHPTLEQARAGFAAEDAAGVDRSASDRNYKDTNHKPEMIFALTPFEALCGFREPADSARLFRSLARLLEASGRPLRLLTETASDLDSGRPDAEKLESVFRRLISGGEAVREAVTAAAETVRSLDTESRAGLDPALAGIDELDGFYPQDPGVLISLLLNRVTLSPGEAIYLPAGNIHAYLSGLGVEVMAASDNVLRGGLTPKHVDIPELLQTVDFRPLGVPRVEAEFTGLGQEIYRPPFSEFSLQRLELAQSAEEATASMSAADVPVLQNGPTLVIALRGSLVLDTPKQDLVLNPGDCAFIPADEAPVIAKLAAHSAQHDDGALAFAVTTGEAPVAGGTDEPQLEI